LTLAEILLSSFNCSKTLQKEQAMSLHQIESMTLKIEIAAAVAQDAFTAKRAKLERQFCDERGWKSAMTVSQFRQMNGMVDILMDRSAEACELTRAMRELKEHNWKVARMRAGYAS
jgi:hypothetical protein